MEATYVTAPGGQQVLILREETSRSRGSSRALSNNIVAARLVSELVRTSLGPKGMDKMLVDPVGDVTITNDGATMLGEMDVQHPAAKMVIETARAVDSGVGDGTTSVVVLIGALLANAEDLIDSGVHPTVIASGYSRAALKAGSVLKEIAVAVNPDDTAMLARIARTSMASKLVSSESGRLAELVVKALLVLAEKKGDGIGVDTDNLAVKKAAGGSLNDTALVLGVILERGIVHSGMPKRIEGARILLLKSPVEIEKTKLDAKVEIDDPVQIQGFLDAEAGMLGGMVEKVVLAGANVLVCQKGIDPAAQSRLAKAGVLSIARAKESEMAALAKATGAAIVTGFEDISAADMGRAGLVEERVVEGNKLTFVEGCKNPMAVTLFVRGGSQRVVDEAERSIHDAVMVVKSVIESPAVVGGGGAAEEEVSRRLMSWSGGLEGREQLAAQKFAEALESIPLTLGENAGFDTLDTQVELRERHSVQGSWYGVDVLGKGVKDTFRLGVIEPLALKEHVVRAAAECACMILRIDDVIASRREGRAPAVSPSVMGG
jgi:thermosome